MSDIEYESIINGLCLTGVIPLNLVDSICNKARNQIRTKFDENLDLRSYIDQKYEDIDLRREEFKSDWFDYEMINSENFSMD